jgi:hypothetical protein
MNSTNSTSTAWRTEERKGGRAEDVIWGSALFLSTVVLAVLCLKKAPEIERESADMVDVLIRRLGAPEGKVKYLCSVNPGGPIFEPSMPMKMLIEHGGVIQPRVLQGLRDPRVRNELALILAQIGDKDALPGLIEGLPTKMTLTPEEDFTSMCFLYALWQLTGMELGIHHKFSPKYTSEFRTKWLGWYKMNKDYLYTPPKPKLTAYGWGRDQVLVDLEAKFAGIPTAIYRQKHPWIPYEEIKNWRDDPAYQQKLKSFCFSLILNLTWNPYGYAPREAIRSLGRIQDPRALSALHALCGMADDSFATHDLVWTLGEKGDPSAIPFLEKIPRSKGEKTPWDSIERTRLRAIERIRLLEQYGKELEGKPFNPEQQDNFMRCLAGAKGVNDLIARIRSDPDCFLPSYLRVARYVDREPMRSSLKEIVLDKSRDDRSRTLVHAALARLGEKDSVDYLKRALTHKQPGVRLPAAEGLWGLDRREGFQTLVEITRLRPLETGGEGVSTGNGLPLTVTAIRGANVEYVRDACKILGEMRDRSAIAPLKRLLSLNLNGVLAGGGSGTGWPGRPDAVALAKLGDFSGIEVLRASISRGDPLEVVGSWGGAGDFVEIGLKRFIPELLPMLEHRDESKRVRAAQSILLLFERGK